MPVRGDRKEKHMNFTEAARLKRFIKENFSVILHIHDTCGGLYISIDEPDELVKEFILAYCLENGIPVTVSSDGRSFFPASKDSLTASEADEKKKGFYDQVDDLDIVYVPAAKRAVAYVNKNKVGYCSYYESDGKWIIDHTVVEELYQDKGIAGKLVECLAKEARKAGVEIEAECSYAIKWFEQHL